MNTWEVCFADALSERSLFQSEGRVTSVLDFLHGSGMAVRCQQHGTGLAAAATFQRLCSIITEGAGPSASVVGTTCVIKRKVLEVGYEMPWHHVAHGRQQWKALELTLVRRATRTPRDIPEIPMIM